MSRAHSLSLSLLCGGSRSVSLVIVAVYRGGAVDRLIALSSSLCVYGASMGRSLPLFLSLLSYVYVSGCSLSLSLSLSVMIGAAVIVWIGHRPSHCVGGSRSLVVMVASVRLHELVALALS